MFDNNFGKCRTIFAARWYASAVLAVMRCLSVCVCMSVTFVHCIKTNKHIFKYRRVATPF